LNEDSPHRELCSSEGERMGTCIRYRKGLSEMEEKIITRRDFLRVTAGTAIAATWGSGILGEARAEDRTSDG